MCGYAGFISFSRIHSKENSRKILESMSQKIEKRGPDDLGFWEDNQNCIGLTHRRLSVIDLSKAGHQPMLSQSGRYVICFNGEIYNHLELRKKNIKDNISWKSSSDTETLLECFDYIGLKSTIIQCSGMFSMSVIDRRRNKLYLIRDRAGEKPLYYGYSDRSKESFIFGSDLASLLEYPNFEKILDKDSITSFLRHNYIPAPKSIYKNICKLPPAHILEFDLTSKEIKIEKYWDYRLKYDQKYNFSYSNADQFLEELLNNSINEQLISDVPLGAFLSGGIDSSLIVALMQKNSSKKINTYSIGFDETKYDESHYAKEIASYLGTAHNQMIVTGKESLSVIPNLPEIYSEPFADSSQIPTYFVSKLARKEVTVALSGDGGDELFGGYTRYEFSSRLWRYLKYVPHNLRNFTSFLISNSNSLYRKLPINLPNFTKWNHLNDKIEKGSEAIRSKDFYELYLRIISHHNNPEIFIKDQEKKEIDYFSDELEKFEDTDKMMYLDFHSYLPDDILVKVDRASMYNSLETRAPFLNHNIVHFASNLPYEWKFGNKHTGFVSKYILKKILYNHVPKKLLERPKMGFGVPIEKWIKKDLNEWVMDLLSYEKMKKDDIFDLKNTQKFIQDYFSGNHNNHYLIWNFIMFQAWKDKFI